MLESLHVKNMALIGEEEIDLGAGLNILTGETGAGKSILIGSVNVALGFGGFKEYAARQDQASLVELVFHVPSGKARECMEQLDLPLEDDRIVIARRYQNGRTISRINGETVSINTVRKIASLLIDIHGQHQHQSLLYPHFHREVLDRFAQEAEGDLPRLCRQYCLKERSAAAKLKEASMDEAQRIKQADLLRYETEEIENAHLTAGEDEQLEQAFTRMANGQRIASALGEVLSLMQSADGISDQTGRVSRLLSSVEGFDPLLGELAQTAAAAEDLLGGLERGINNYLDDFSYDEKTFQEISDRLDLINHLKAKYGKTLEEVEEYRIRSSESLEKLDNYESWIETLRREADEALKQYRKTAQALSAVRRENAVILEKCIRESLKDLNFPDVRFEIRFRELDHIDESGMDEVEFYISTNPGMELRPIGDVASGGELSRIMLGIKSVLAAQDEVETLIFDEIDTGISGRTAQMVSEKMNQIAMSHQVICITHLAQIAAMADVHFEISKKTDGGQTSTRIRRLDERESIEELARILGGVSITEAVRGNAAEMRALALEKKNFSTVKEEM